jgi:hypothetical protein
LRRPKSISLTRTIAPLGHGRRGCDLCAGRGFGRSGDRSKKLTERLRWELEWGSEAQWLESLAEEQGFEPSALLEREELLPGVEIVWQAFADLTNDRSSGLGAISGIPFLSIDAWARRYRVAEVDFGRFHYLLKAMDATLLTFKKPREPSDAD